MKLFRARLTAYPETSCNKKGRGKRREKRSSNRGWKEDRSLPLVEFFAHGHKLGVLFGLNTVPGGGVVLGPNDCTGRYCKCVGLMEMMKHSERTIGATGEPGEVPGCTTNSDSNDGVAGRING